MTLPTAVTGLLGVTQPILLAPMGGAAGGALAAAVSNGGGFGLVGGGRESAEWVTRELEVVRRSTRSPWGIGFLTFATDSAMLERALLGTRFLACVESLARPSVVKAVLEGGAEDTERNRVLDIARRAPWPSRYTARTMRNAFSDRWRGREEELSQSSAVLDERAEAAERGDMDVLPVWAGESMDLFDRLESATDVVGAITRQAEEALDQIERPSPAAGD